MQKKRISIVVPCYNEEANLAELQKRISEAIDPLTQYDFEILLVENGSSDGSWKIMNTIAASDSRFKAIELSKNFTAPGGITAGFQHATGDAAIVMCADLQDPPEYIPQLIEKWEEGYDIVYQIVTVRQGVSKIRSGASLLFHWMMDKLTDGHVPRNATVFRIMDRMAYEAFNDLRETNRYFPGLCSWIGFKSTGIEFPREERFAGEAKSPFRVVFRLALNGIFAFSYMPLKLMTYFGIFVATGALLYLITLITTVVLDGSKAIPGIATLIALTLFLFGGLFLSMGIVGEYLARIYDEVKGRPNFIVKRKIGFTESPKPPLVVKGTYQNGTITLADQHIDLTEEDQVTVQLS